MPNSGEGWNQFWVDENPNGGGGVLRAKSPLDFENPDHRHGFRFRVQVTDMVSVLSF